jgi:hypothetical protein
VHLNPERHRNSSRDLALGRARGRGQHLKPRPHAVTPRITIVYQQEYNQQKIVCLAEQGRLSTNKWVANPRSMSVNHHILEAGWRTFARSVDPPEPTLPAHQHLSHGRPK